IDREIGYKFDEIKEKLSQENASQDEIFGGINSTLDTTNEIEWQHYLYHALDDEEEISNMFIELDQAYKEDVVSQLDEPDIFEKVEDMELMTKDDTIKSSYSNVPIGRPRKMKRVEFDNTASGVCSHWNLRKRRRLNKDERFATDIVDDVEE
ncbi:hypothetical protein Tco_1296787, partial [Tanacetum coccineum]